MQDYKPYNVIEESDSRLYIKEPNWRKNVYFFVFRILPFFFLLEVLAALFFTYGKSEIPRAGFVGLFIFNCIPAAILFSRRYITEIDLTPLGIEFTRNTLSGKQQIAYAITDIDHFLWRKKHGKGGGYFYYIVLKTGNRRVRFLRFSLFRTSDQKINAINDTIKKISRLEVVEK